MNKVKCSLLLSICIFIFQAGLYAQDFSKIIFQDVRVFDGRSANLSGLANVLVIGNKISKITSSTIEKESDVLVINGQGKTLIPGLIDNHVHLTFGSMTMLEMMSPTLNAELILQRSSIGAKEMLLRGFTSVRDVGGPIFQLKAKIDAGAFPGPRVWPSGATISQTAGHGDFRTVEERSRKFFGKPSKAELFQATFIADGRSEVLTAVRENLRFGASQIKLMAGGGTSSAYDPVDVTQYTLDEMKAAVEAAEDWGTYVTVHAYTVRAVRRAIEAGVKCIEHGQLLDDKTLKLMARKNIWLSLQNLVKDTPNMDSLRRAKRKPVIEGQEKVWPIAKKYKVKLAWGTDFLFEPELNKQQNKYILDLQKWFSNAEILKMITYDNARLLQLSGLRSPYQGNLGVIEEGALADLILVDGNPLEDLSLIANPEENFMLIMKDGKIFKNTLAPGN